MGSRVASSTSRMNLHDRCVAHSLAFADSHNDKYPSNEEKQARDKENKPIELVCQHSLSRVDWTNRGRCFPLYTGLQSLVDWLDQRKMILTHHSPVPDSCGHQLSELCTESPAHIPSASSYRCDHCSYALLVLLPEAVASL